MPIRQDNKPVVRVPDPSPNLETIYLSPGEFPRANRTHDVHSVRFNVHPPS
jgi:hypothetical protein